MRKAKADISKLAIDGDIALLVMSCCSLGLLFHVNYVVIMFYGLPFLTEPAWTLHYYINAGNHPWSLSRLFLWVTLMTSSSVVLTVWYRSRKLSCKWRLRFLALLMSTICFGFAALCSSLEEFTVKDTKCYIVYLKEYLKEVEDEPIWKRQILREIRLSEEVLKQWERSETD